ncbi:hypothetical protein ACLEJQ_22245 [Pseudomonas sp. SMV71]|uniref:hypothetical protein n=1 Tax=Pseudomonas sp. SMV71 TaxID=3390195 RepID=UPI003F82CF35
MTEHKHTPGPWVRCSTAPKIIMSGSFIDGHQGYMVGSVTGNDNSGYYASEQEAEANAKLIAAAPDLLEALEYLKRELILSDVDLDYIESHFRPWLNKAESAVAKARGYLFSPMPVTAKATQ